MIMAEGSSIRQGKGLIAGLPTRHGLGRVERNHRVVLLQCLSPVVQYFKKCRWSSTDGGGH